MNSKKIATFILSIITIFTLLITLLDACTVSKGGSSPKTFWDFFGPPTQPDSVCFPNLGCFSTTIPFSDLPPPQDPAEIPPIFFVLHMNETNDGVVSREIKNATDLNTTNLVVMTHGFTGSYNNTKNWNEPITLGLFRLDPNVNILFIEWEVGAQLCFDPIVNIYSQPASNTRSIAAASANFLKKNPDFNITKSYCIGFSLGAHVCSFISKHAKQKWRRLSAIDPAAPLFNKPDNPEARVDKSDALFVDALHTSKMGIDFAVGHVDFYVNRINLQPGCEKEFMPAGTPSWIMGKIMGYFACGHYRAPVLFSATINPPSDPKCQSTYRVCPCVGGDIEIDSTTNCPVNETQLLGFNSYKFPERGGYYCGKTSSDPPFCL